MGLGIALTDYTYSTSIDPISFAYTPLERGLIAARALAFYVGKLLWPTGLIGIYPRWEPGIGDALAWSCAVGFAAVVAVLWGCRRQLGRGPLAGVLFFVVALSPTLGFVDFGYMQFSFVADRYQYLAGIGLIAVVAAILAVSCILTWNHAGIYRNPGTFFTHVIAHNPKVRGAHLHLGNHLQTEGRYREVRAAYDTALELQPDNPGLISNIGALLENQSRHEEAIAHFRKVLRLDPQHLNAMRNLAVVLINQKRYTEGVAAAQKMIARYPNNAMAHHLAGIGLFHLNRKVEALRYYDRALALDPNLKIAREQRKQFFESMTNEERQ